MSNKILCDRCNKIMEPWRGEGLVKFAVNLWSKNKRKQADLDLCENCKKEFGKFINLDTVEKNQDVNVSEDELKQIKESEKNIKLGKIKKFDIENGEKE